ncbi:Inner membrane transport protein YeaN [Serratia entomophila]|nr:Inner membrane transport protein YeaN [Serratia entomophila]
MPQSTFPPIPAAPKRSRLRHPLPLIAGIMLVAANLRAALTSVGPLLEQIQQQLTLSATAAGLLNSLPLILFAVLSPLTPGLAKRLGIERTLGLALALLAIGIMLRSLPQNLMLWLGTALIGAAIAFANVVLPTLVKRDYPHRAAAMIAAYAAVMSLVAATASGLAVPLATLNDLGWRFSLLCWSLPALLALLVWLPQLRQPAPPRHQRRSRPPTGAITLPLGQRPGLAGGDVYGAAIDRLLHHYRLVQRLCRQPWHLTAAGGF